MEVSVRNSVGWLAQIRLRAPRRKQHGPTVAPEVHVEQVTRATIGRLAVGLCDLDRQVRARNVPPDFWQWLYFSNPAGDAVAVVAAHDSRPVGRFECVPVRLVAGGEISTAYHLQGLTLARDFRQWAHLNSLLSAALDAQHSIDPIFSFGFTTSAATRLHASLGLPVLGRVSMFAAAIDGGVLLGGRGFPSPLGALAGPFAGVLMRWRTGLSHAAVEVRETADFTSAFDDLATPSGPDSIGLRKDAGYLNWRYVQRPGACYRRLTAWKNGEPAGLLVWRAEDVHRDGYILELAVRDDDPDTMDGLLHASRKQMQSAGVGLVTASFPRSSAAARALVRVGFVGWYSLWKKMSLAVVPGRKGRFAGMSLAQWRYSLGDWLYH